MKVEHRAKQTKYDIKHITNYMNAFNIQTMYFHCTVTAKEATSKKILK